ncbi:unnamed protein product [Soboliphyme baturini]|uniref:RUN domain-containing protein n=1 Tax=Soboliphyme baturini TaxID=241478 RepID=A0A183IWM2_9BILA|nr:unnamed protein product [Soboliphyme baturini]
MAAASLPDTSVFENIIMKLKAQSKQVMEEAAVKRFVCEDGNSVTSLCATVEQCLRSGLRNRIFGLFGRVSTFALLHKIAPFHQPAATVLQLTVQSEKRRSIERRISDSSDPASPKSQYLWIRIALTEKLLAQIVNYVVHNAAARISVSVFCQLAQ